MADELKLRITADADQAKREMDSLRGSAGQALQTITKESTSANKIMREAFVTGSSEIIESWGVDGDIANEIGKMLGNLPTQAKVALVAMGAAFLGAAATAGALVAVTLKMVDVAKEIGDGSAEDFRKLQKEMKAAGVTVSELDRALSQELTKSFDQVKLAVDGMFLEFVREAGPAAVVMFRTIRDEINSMAGTADGFGKILKYAFIGVTAEVKTFLQTIEHAINAVDLFMKGGQINRVRALAELAQAVAVSQRFEQNLQSITDDVAAFKPGAATYETKDEKGPDRAAARERLERELDRLRIRNAQVTTEGLRENEVLRAATDAYIESLRGKIETFKGFVALTEGQSKAYTDGVRLALAAGRELLQLQTQTAEIELQRLSTFYGNELVIAQARAELERQNEIARYEAAKREIETNIANNATNLEAQRLYYLQLKELEKQHTAQMEAIKRGEQLQTERANPTSSRSLFGDAFADELQKSQNRLRAFAAAARQSFAEASAAAGNMGTIGSRAFGQFAAGLGEVVRQFVLTGTTGPAALRRLTAAVLAEVAQQASVKAIFELAEGFAALFLDPPEAAAHFQAAALYGAVAGIAGGVGAAVSPGASSANGGALGNALAANSASQQTETRYRFNERDGSGAIASNIIVTIKTDQAQQIANVERAALSSYRQGGTLKAIADNAFSGIPITTG